MKSLIGFVVLTLAALTSAQMRTLSDVEYYCGNKPADVVFLLDVSNSIWGPDFQKQLVFVQNVIDMFTIAENVTRVGIVSFSQRIFHEFDLNDYFDKDEMKDAVRNIRQRTGFVTSTGRALWYLRKRMFRNRRGSRKNVAKIGIVLTDGQSAHQGRTIVESFRARMAGIHLFAIGIGNNVNKKELEAISTNSEDKLFMVDSYSALDAIKNTLAVRTCKILTTTTTTTTTSTTTTTTTTTTPPPTTTSKLDRAKKYCEEKRTDVVFAIDSSDNIKDNDYIKQAQFFNTLAESFDISPETTRVGSLLYSDQIQEMFDIVEYESIEGVRKGMSTLGMTAGNGRVDLALRHILTKNFRRTNSRPATAQVGVIVTGSPSKYLEISKHIAKKSSKVGVEYIIIGVGDLVNEEELKIISDSNSNHMFHLESFDDLEQIVGDVAMEICGVQPPRIQVLDQPCGAKQEADIMFLMDSVNAGRRNTKIALSFLKSIVNELDIDNDNIHVGLMSAECEQDIQGFGLGSHSSKKQIEQTFNSMKGTDFHKIIRNMRRGSFRSSSGARKHAKKIAILIVDGSLEEPIKTLTEAQRAKIHGVEVFVIQVGDENTQEELLMMCDDPSSQHFYKVPHYGHLPALKEKLLQSLCDEL